MNRIQILHLTIVGADVEAATVEFGPGLTVIHGSSETGKSYVAGALDFMFGARTPPKQIVEAANYTYAMLGLKFDDGRVETFIRPLDGGNYRVYRQDVRSMPVDQADFALSPQHSDRNFDNFSNYLLRELGIPSKRLRRNQQNQTSALSFRNLIHYCVINETAMQSEISPVLTGQYVSRTTERSTFKFLLEGEDDSSLTESAKGNPEVSRGKLEVVDRLISETESSLDNVASRSDLEMQLSRIKSSLREASVQAAMITAQRDSLINQRRVQVTAVESEQDRMDELLNLAGRFKLLQDQYESDLARLEMVGEVGELLGYFRPGVCVFCGASEEHQHPEIHATAETTEIGQSVESEQRRTRLLLDDLLETITSVEQRIERTETALTGARGEVAQTDSALAEIDEAASPIQTSIEELSDIRSSVEQSLSLYDHLDRLQQARIRYDEEQSQSSRESSSSGERPVGSVLYELCQTVSGILEQWLLPESSPVDFDRANDDLVVAGRPRRARGKGMRSILHAAFNLGLLEYCRNRDLPHPGFVVLDSPLITYREPYGIPEEDDIESEAVTGWVADAFYRHLAGEFDGQAIILENIDPPDDVVQKSDAAIVFFTKSPTEGRYGFFPDPLKE